MSKPLGVVFDLDDTLSDYTAVEAQVWAATAELLARDHPAVDATAARERFVAAREPLFERVLAGEMDVDGFRRGQLRAAVEPVLPSDALLDEHVALREEINRAPQAVAGALDLLDGLRAVGVRVAVLTNGAASMVDAKLAAIGLADHVDAVLTAAGVGAPKPDPRAYAAAAEALGLTPDRVAMVGDHLEWDVAAPLRAGYASAAWLWRPEGEPPASVPDGGVLVRTLAEVPAALGIASSR